METTETTETTERHLENKTQSKAQLEYYKGGGVLEIYTICPFPLIFFYKYKFLQLGEGPLKGVRPLKIQLWYRQNFTQIKA